MLGVAMPISIISQPEDSRFGDELNSLFEEVVFTNFIASVAFVSSLGVLAIKDRVQAFLKRGGKARFIVGVSRKVTTVEGLQTLLELVSKGADVRVFHNENPSVIYHPKGYLIEGLGKAVLLVGSNNMTGKGLFENYELSVACHLNPKDKNDALVIKAAKEVFDRLADTKNGLCKILTEQLLNELNEEGYLGSEAKGTDAPEGAGEGDAGKPAAPPKKRLFGFKAVKGAPKFAKSVPAVAASAPTPVGGVSSFVITLQKTDVGVGQITMGTSRRSPEVFIPLAVLDQHPAFWTFPDQFTDDVAWNNSHPKHRRNGIGKMDRMNVPMRVGTIQSVRMFFNPQKGDFRLRNEALRSSGGIGDILLVKRVDPVNGFEYDIQVAPKGSPQFAQLAPLCNIQVPNSQKRFGYF